MNSAYVAEVSSILSDDNYADSSEAYTDAETVFLETMTQIGKPRDAITMPGWAHFNEMLSGFPAHEFSILCGPTGAGKTTLLASWALALIASSTPAYVAPVEIGSHEFMKKLISSLTGRAFDSIAISERDVIKKNAYPVLGSGLMVFGNYTSRINHLNLLADIYHAHKTKGIRVAFVDNLNFMMDVTRAQDQLMQMDRTVHDFVIFCKRVPVHIVMVMHPKKTEGGRIVSEFDIKGSSTSVQEACNVLLFNRLESADMAPFGANPSYCRELIIRKSRFNGRAVGKRIILSLDNKSELLREVGYAEQ